MSDLMEVQTAVGRWVLGNDGIARDKTYAREEINIRARIDEHEDGNNFIISWDEERMEGGGKYRVSQFQGCPVEIVREIVGPSREEILSITREDALERERLQKRVAELEKMTAKAWEFYQNSGVMREPDGRTGNDLLDKLGSMLDEYASTVGS